MRPVATAVARADADSLVRRWVVRAALLLGLVGCYAPAPEPGAPCASGRCPSGLVCAAATNTCEREDVDAGVRDAIDASPTGPALVQAKGNQQPGVPAMTVTLDAKPVAGHLLVMTGADPAAGLDGVSGGGVPAWVRAASSTVNANIEIWYGITDGTSAAITISLANANGIKTAVVSEWVRASGTLDGAQAGSGSTSPAHTAEIETTGPTIVIFAAANFAPNTFDAPGPGTWIEIPYTPPVAVQQQWYRIVADPVKIAPTVALTGNLWDAAIAAFRAPP